MWRVVGDFSILIWFRTSLVFFVGILYSTDTLVRDKARTPRHKLYSAIYVADCACPCSRGVLTRGFAPPPPPLWKPSPRYAGEDRSETRDHREVFAVSGSLRDLFPLFVALPFVSVLPHFTPSNLSSKFDYLKNERSTPVDLKFSMNAMNLFRFLWIEYITGRPCQILVFQSV